MTYVNFKTSPVALLAIAFILLLNSCKEKATYEPVTEDTVFLSTKELPDSLFVGDSNCKTCHQKEYADWQGSHHDKAMELANDTSVLAPFEGEEFSSFEVTSRFYKKDGDYYVNTEGPEGTYDDYKIIYTFGVTPLQQYIVEFPDGKFQCLSTAWDTEKGAWFNLYPDFKVVHSEWLHWSNKGLNWNTMCSDCHSTNVKKNYHLQTDSYNTQYALINVSCEACHGSGREHVEEASRLGDKYKPKGNMRMILSTTPKQLVDECARCHMRREQFTNSFNYEGTMLDHYFPQLLEEPFYFPDGQILDEDYVYASFTQSKMYKNNIACNNCHNSHSLELKFEGNMLCAQCHAPATYDSPLHHKHETNTEGSKCINCHMTGRFYMGNDFRRDHSFRVPRPDQSLKYGTPNACVDCHTDKDNEWAWKEFQNLYGEVDFIHFSDKLIPGVLGHANAEHGLLDLIKDTSENELVRASAVKALGHYELDPLIREYLNWLNDASPVVRGATLDVLSNINTADYANYFLPLLNDKKRSVRVKAFYALGTLDASQVPAEYLESYKKVEKEFFGYLDVTSDFVGGLAKRANYNIKKGNIQEAISYYEKAIEVDNLDNRLRYTLANLYYNVQSYEKAEHTFRAITEREPDFGPTYYSLALLYAELGRTDDAIREMNTAIIKMPENIRTYYNLSLLYDQKGDKGNAETTLIKGLKMDPNNADLFYALAFHYSKYNEMNKALNIAEKLMRLYPNNPQYSNFYRQLQSN